MEDHLHLQIMDFTGEWEKSWNTLNQLELEIGKAVDLAYHPRFGYLTAQPERAGTGLRVLVYLHLPALIHTGRLDDTLTQHKPDDVIATSMQGSLSEIPGDVVVLKNAYTLGVSEQSILHTLHLVAMRLITLEKTLRSELRQSPRSDIKDKVSRSFGLLAHSYQLQTKEALQGLSLLKLGVDLGWIRNTTCSDMDNISLQCHRAHLLHLSQNPALTPDETSEQRAKWIHPLIQHMELHI